MADEEEASGVTADAGSAFAALMSGAAGQVQPDEAPFGYTTDRQTGESRPKKAPGRPRKPPTVEELRAEKDSAPPPDPAAATEDRAPKPGKRRLAGRGQREDKPREPVPQYRSGQIQQGVNRLYRKAGKIVKAMDRDIGIAIIEATQDDEDGTGSVGWAWDQLARTNPRIRAFLLKTLTGGAWGALMMAHLPILMAIIMKDGIRKHIPFMRLISAWAEPDEDSAPGEGGLPGGMNEADLGQMMQMANGLMAQMGMGAAVPGRRGPVVAGTVTPEAEPGAA